jgi:plasmid maintenance system antidote protein VapI
LSKYFGNSAQFWLGIQNDFDIEQERDEKKYELEKIQKFEAENVA